MESGIKVIKYDCTKVPWFPTYPLTGIKLSAVQSTLYYTLHLTPNSPKEPFFLGNSTWANFKQVQIMFELAFGHNFS